MTTIHWTEAELRKIAETAIANAQDDAADGPLIQTFESEMEFQLNAPEHRNRPAPTEDQMEFMRQIWEETICRESN